MPDDKTPFPFPPGYETKLENKYKAKSIRDYISLFERGRSIRKDGKLADADIQEIMRLAEDLGRVDTTEIDVMRALVDQRPEYFRDEAQQDELESFARVHILKDTIRQDPLVADILDAAPISFYRKPEAIDWMRTAQELARVMRKNEAYYDEHDTFDPGLIDELDKVAQELGDIIKDDADFTLSDIDDVAARARKSFFRDVKNFLLRSVGETDHESKFDDGQWVNWNRDIEVYPERYLTPANRAEAVDIVKRHNPVRMVAGGHTFNISPSMGGDEGTPQGTLVSLDAYAIDADRRWQRIDAGAAQQKYNLPDDEAKRVVRASAGIRLRDFGDEMWAERMTLPVAGSTDAQSLGGLVATDLHSTGHTAGFLSQQILEIIAIDGNGALVHFVKNEGVARRTPGRWTVNFADSTQQKMGTLAAAGAIGTCGAVIEVVLKLDTAFNLEKSQHFVPRRWAEDNIDKLIDSADHGEHFDYDHVSMYYPGGAGMTPTVRMNTWKRTNKRVSSGVEILKAIRELFDHVGSAFLPKTLLNLARRKAATPGDPPRPDDDDWLASLNRRKPLVLPANKAFARQLFFQHDEIEVGIPLPTTGGVVDYHVFRDATAATQKLLKDEEFDTILEIRFTPDASEATIGPGTGGPTCYIELATPLGQHSRRRIAHVHHLFDEMMRREYGARPHLGKKTSVDEKDMASCYGASWSELADIRARIDPANKFLPADNALLQRIFRP